MIHDKFNCVICKQEFPRRKKGMKDRAYKKPLRPYRSITCSTKCASVYNRMPLKERNLLKAQGGIKQMENNEEVILSDDIELCSFDNEEGFGMMIQSEEKYNPKLPEEVQYYHDVILLRHFKDKKNLVLLRDGIKQIQKALWNEDELAEQK